MALALERLHTGALGRRRLQLLADGRDGDVVGRALHDEHGDHGGERDVLVLDPEQFDGRFRITFGPGRFLDPDTVSPLLIAVVGRLDLFTLWITVLLAIGLSVTGRVPLSRAMIPAAIVWFLGDLPIIFQALRTM